MTSYYQKNKFKWKTKYNKTDYNKTKTKRARKYMYIIENNGIRLKFRSQKDILKYAKRVNFDFETDFNDLIIV